MPFIPFTTETAKEAGRKSGEARRANPVLFLEPMANHEPIIETNKARTIQSRLRILAEQISNTRAELNEDPAVYCEHCKQGARMMPHHRAQLLKALDNLIEREAFLLGIPGPGNLKPSAPTRQRRSLPEPTPLAPDVSSSTQAPYTQG